MVIVVGLCVCMHVTIYAFCHKFIYESNMLHCRNCCDYCRRYYADKVIYIPRCGFTVQSFASLCFHFSVTMYTMAITSTLWTLTTTTLHVVSTITRDLYVYCHFFDNILAFLFCTSASSCCQVYNILSHFSLSLSLSLSFHPRNGCGWLATSFEPSSTLLVVLGHLWMTQSQPSTMCWVGMPRH